MKAKAGIACALMLLLAGQAFAGGQSSGTQAPSKMGKSNTGMHSEQGTIQRQFGTSSVSRLMDKDVVGRNGEELGSVSDLILDQRGNVAFVVISRGGAMGIGDRMIPIPVSAFQQSSGDDLKVNIDRSRLDSAPHYSSNNLPNFDDRNWQQEVRGYYGASGSKGGMMKGGSDGFVHGHAGGVGPGGSGSPGPGAGSVEGSSTRSYPEESK